MNAFDQFHRIIVILHIEWRNGEVEIYESKSCLPVSWIQLVWMGSRYEHVTSKLRIRDSNRWQSVRVASD